MFKKIIEQYIYKFNTPQKGLYSLSISASCKSGKILGLFGGEDLRVEINDLKLREIPAKSRAQYFNIPPAWNGTKLKGLSKTVIFVLELDKGTQTIKFIPQRGAIIEKEPEVKLIKNSHNIKLNLNKTAENNRNRQPWITLALINLPLNILDVSVKCEKRFLDSDDIKPVIDDKIQRNKQAGWWGKNWYWQGRKLQGKTEETRFYPNLSKGIHYLEFWADRKPTLNWVEMGLGIKKDGTQKDDKTPTVDNPKWTGDFNDDPEQMILARVIWGEARGTSKKVRTAVAWSIKNRVGTKTKWNTYHNTILDPAQYSAFWEDPEDFKGLSNIEALKDPLGTTNNPDDHRKWKETHEIAGQVIKGEITDPTNGANHYYDDSIPRPKWLTEENFIIKIDNICFHKL